MKILMPVDASEYTTRTLEYLAAHKELLPGDHEVTVFTVIEPTSPSPSTLSKARTLEGFMGDQAEQVLGPVRAFFEQQGWKLKTDYVPGSAVQSIVTKAEALKPDLIVMGTRARSPFGTFVLGSVANGVLAQCKFPVLLIR